MEQSGTLTNQWTHDLFNTNVFSVTTYQQQLADFILNNHDWGAESQMLKNELIQEYGSDWKQEVAGLVSWQGLTETQEFSVWAATHGYPTGINAEGETTCADLFTVLGTFSLLGNQNCN